MAIEPGSKYFPLYQFLQSQESNQLQLQFTDIERLLRTDLPPSARQRRGFWSNRQRGGHQASAWLMAGYRVVSVNLQAGTVEFVRTQERYQIPRRQGSLVWDAEALRALRRFLGLNQSEFAEVMGVRQQTVSEWETGQYQPTRSRSKHIQILAERAEFPYSVEDEA